MTKITLVIGTIIFLFFASSVYAQTMTDIKTEMHQMQLQGTEQLSPFPTLSPTSSPTSFPTHTTVKIQPQATSQNQVSNPPKYFENLQDRISTVETQSQKTEDPKVYNWFVWWWKMGFLVGILWLFPWIFVGWQWTHFKFWGFGWPWPWWFWIPVLWFIPWFIIGWQWWLVWWVWWVWIWWLFPWVFWIFWWIILFKESTIWVWKRK